jgi:hypothetical protein
LWHSINSIAIKFLRRVAPRFPIKNAQKITIIDDDNVYNHMFDSPSITENPYLCGHTLVDWNVGHTTFGSVITVVQIFVDHDPIINQWNTLDHLGLFDHNKRFMCDGNQVVVMKSLISHSSLKRTHNISTYNHIRELIA